METLTTQSLTACNIYVRAAHRAQRRTILGNSPWMTRSANKQKHTWLCLCTEDIAGHEWPAMADTHKTNVQKKKKKQNEAQPRKACAVSFNIHLSTEKTTPLGPWQTPADLKRCRRAHQRWSEHKSSTFTLPTAHTVVVWPWGRTRHTLQPHWLRLRRKLQMRRSCEAPAASTWLDAGSSTTVCVHASPTCAGVLSIQRLIFTR